MIKSSACFKTLRPSPHGPRLIVFPHSGAGAYSTHRWLHALPSGLEVCAIQRPGREDRVSETAERSLRRIVDESMAELEARMDRPYLLFGHSLGGFLAYQTAARIEERGLHPPSHLFISAVGPAPVANARDIAQQLFKEQIRTRLTQDWKEASNDDVQELTQMAAAAYESDLHLHFSCHHDTVWPVLDIPVTTFYGTRDRLADRAALQMWQRYTNARFDSIEVEGAHMFIETSSGLNAVAREIARHTRDLPGGDV
jgi:surfactin synthase thioesterase subunit